MRATAAIWFECKVRYDKMQEDGLKKKVVEQYVVNALSFTEAEAQITKEVSQYISGDYEVTDIKKAPYKEVLFSEQADADRWFRAKLDFITINEKTEKEKRSRVVYLVQANTLRGALKGVEEVMSGTMIDFDAACIDDTKIMDVFEASGK